MQLAEAVLRIVIANGPAVIADAGDLDAMSEIMWCGSLSHNGLTGLGGAKGLSVHPVSFALSEKYDIIHGEALSALWCSWARYVCKVNEDNYKLFARYARNVWDIAEPDVKKAANAGIDASEAYFKSACRFRSASSPAACRMRPGSKTWPPESATTVHAASARLSAWTMRRCARFSRWRTTKRRIQ